MKEGWSYKKLGEVARVIHGKNQKEVLSENGQYPIYGSGGTVMGYANDFLCEARTTILGRKGSINNPQFIEKRFWNVDTAFGITALPGNDSKFIYYFVKSIDWSKKNTGTTLPSLTQQVVTSVEIPVPTLPEQRSIVTRLDAAFSHIDALKANAEKHVNEARKLFQAELTECMKPKEGWEEKKLGEVGTFSRGINFAKNDFVKDGYPCIHYGQIHTTFGPVTYEHLTSIPNGMVRHDKLASKGNLIIAITSEDVAGSCKCTAWMGDYDISVGAHAAIYKHELNPIFMSYYFKSSIFQQEKEPYVHGFKVMEIKPSDIAKIPIVFPSKEDQQIIVSHLDSLSSNIRKLEELQQKTIAECDALKQAMLREVFE
jgi:type I restriction enzyme S subunit